MRLALYHDHKVFRKKRQTLLLVQWSGLQVSAAGGTDSIPGQGTKIPVPQGMAKIIKFLKSIKRIAHRH